MKEKKTFAVWCEIDIVHMCMSHDHTKIINKSMLVLDKAPFSSFYTGLYK